MTIIDTKQNNNMKLSEEQKKEVDKHLDKENGIAKTIMELAEKRNEHNKKGWALIYKYLELPEGKYNYSSNNNEVTVRD